MSDRIDGRPRPSARWRVAVVALLIAGGGILPLALGFAGILPPVTGLVPVTMLFALLYWALRRRIHAILLVFLGVMLAATVVDRPVPKLAGDEGVREDPGMLVDAWRAQGSFDDRLPIVVHLIFDEMMSTGAIDESIPGGSEVKQGLYALGDDYGLRTFDSVYSRHYSSGVSIPNLMNAGFEGRGGTVDLIRDVQVRTTANAYFDAMADRGYRTVVFETAVLDFCDHPAVRMCETFDSFNPESGEMAHLDLSTRTLDLWSTLFRALEPSYVSEYGHQFLRWGYGLDTRELGVLGVANRYDVHGFPAWFDRFVEFVSDVPRGTHVFAHFMTPHSPYLLTSGCVVSGAFDSGYYLATRFASEEIEEKRRQYYAEYFEQLSCVRRRLGELLAALSDAGPFHDATIIVHGDHGSRISAGRFVEEHQPRDFIDNYATYFAVKSPGIGPGLDCQFSTLSRLFRRFTGGAGATSAPTDPSPPVILYSRAGDDVRVQAPMPMFGCAAP